MRGLDQADSMILLPIQNQGNRRRYQPLRCPERNTIWNMQSRPAMDYCPEGRDGEEPALCTTFWDILITPMC